MTTSPTEPHSLAPADADGRADLERRLRSERERSLNATDRAVGAEAEAVQARARIKELEYLLHVREAELAEATELLGRHQASAPPPEIPVPRRATGPAMGLLRAAARRAGIR